MSTVPDPFQGTTYRALLDAEDAVSLARFHGSEGGIEFDSKTAVEQIDVAVVALRRARNMLTHEFV